MAAFRRGGLLLLVLLAVCCAGRIAARKPAGPGTGRRSAAGIAYWDLDRLYDTLPGLFYDDRDYTPGGRLRWDSERYTRKIRNTAAVIDSMALPLVALWGVENESVVRDIVRTCRGGYSYLHRTLNTLDGMDFALLYYGDLFFPERVEEGRRYLVVEGVLRRGGGHCDTLGVMLCAEPEMAAWVAGDLRRERPELKLVLMGRIGGFDAAACGMYDATARAAGLGRGNIRRRGGWHLRDRIAVDTALRVSHGDVYVRRFLLDEVRGEPLPTYDGRSYRGGYGYALPVFIYLE